MGFFRTTGRAVKWAVKPAVDAPSWFGARQIRLLTTRFFGESKGLFRIQPKPAHPETFEEAVARLQLTDDELVKRRSQYLQLAVFCGFLGLLVLGYSVYLFLLLDIAPAILSFLLALLVFIYAFRFHFWFFQIKHRKLGCTLREWWQSKVEDTSSES
jgi:intracellular multiplication protein IcmV